MGHGRRNPDRLGQVVADEDDTRVGGRGAKLDPDVAPAPVAETFDNGRRFDGALLSWNVHQDRERLGTMNRKDNRR